MQTISELKQDLEFNRNIGDIIEVLKASSIIQFRALQFKEKPDKNYLLAIQGCFDMLDAGRIEHPYVYERKGLPSLIVVVTSDEGFLGELNTLLVNAALDQARGGDDEIVVLGERGAKYLEDMDKNFVSLSGIPDDIDYRQLEGIRDYLFAGYLKRFGRALIVYPEFISLTTQRVTVLQYLPYGLQPRGVEKSFPARDVLICPGRVNVLERLVELWAAFKIFEIAWSSKQSEYAARIMHLEGSSQELSHLNQRLSFNYFRLVHAKSDKSIREVSASKMMLERER